MRTKTEEQSGKGQIFATLFQGGCGVLAVSFGMSLVILTVLRISVGPQLTDWWRDKFGDPIFRLSARVLIAANGDTALFIVLCGLGLALFMWAVRFLPATLTRASMFRFRATSPQSLAVDAVQDQLRQMFSDDPEQIALYESRRMETHRKLRPTRPLLIGGLGCAFSIVWSIISVPLSFLVTLAVFDSLHRLFGAYQAARSMEKSAGPLSVMLNRFLPLHEHALGVDLLGRSALLCIILALLAILYWFVKSTPVAGFMWPKGSSRTSWISFFLGLSLTYVLANALVLWLMLIVLVCDLISVSSGRFIVRPLRLNAGALWTRIMNRRHHPPAIRDS